MIQRAVHPEVLSKPPWPGIPDRRPLPKPGDLAWTRRGCKNGCWKNYLQIGEEMLKVEVIHSEMLKLVIFYNLTGC